MYSVLMSVYHKENPAFLSLAIESVLNQSVKTDDFVIVCDGELTEALDSVLKDYCKDNQCIHLLRFSINRGLGLALNDGVSFCKNDIIMRMDSDDYSVPTRAEEQMKIILEGYDITSSYVGEFENDHNCIKTVRSLPLNQKSIRKFIKKRSPFNHPATMYRKAAVLAAGNYRNVPFKEDYDLWVRMLHQNVKAKNTDLILVHMRVGNGMLERRFSETKKSKKIVRKELLQFKMINRFEYCIFSLAEFMIGIMPKRLKVVVYKRLLRKKYEK